MVQILKEEKEKQEKRKLKQKSNGSNNNKEGFFVVREGARSRDPPVNVLDTVGSVFTTFLVMIIILAVYILLGYSSACMLTRYAHYVFFENGQTGENPKQAFLGINDKDENGNIVYSSVYCESKEDKNQDGNDGNNEKGEKEQEKQKGNKDTIESFGIEKDGVVHKLPGIPLFDTLYSYDGSCDNSKESSLKRIGMNTISGIRSLFKDLFLKFTILSDNTGVPNGIEDKDELFNKQVNRFGFSLIPLYLLIGFIIAIIISPLGSIIDEIFKFDIIGMFIALVRAPIDMIVYAIYGLIFILGIKWNVRTDFFGDVYGDNTKYEYPNLIEYLCSKGNSYILMLWSIATIITLSLSTTNFEFNSYSITSIVIGLFGLFICLYNTILDLCNENTAK